VIEQIPDHVVDRDTLGPVLRLLDDPSATRVRIKGEWFVSGPNDTTTTSSAGRLVRCTSRPTDGESLRHRRADAGGARPPRPASARQLAISEATVKTKLLRVFAKLV